MRSAHAPRLRVGLRCALAAVLGVVILAQVGCAGANLINWNRLAAPEADERNPVRKIVCIWEPVQGQGLDGLPSRGFAGQIMFFTHKSDAPATSEGDVRVYLFHNRGTPEEQAKPIHQFDFAGKAWSTHLQESMPGPSYRIFIPYVGKHPWQTTCGLRVRLTPPNGPPVFSEMVHVSLPGPIEKQADEEGAASKPTPVRTPANISEFQFGASLSRERSRVPGKARVTPASHLLAEGAGNDGVVAADYSEAADDVAPNRQAARRADLPRDPEDERMRQLEAMLNQMKQGRRSAGIAEPADEPAVESKRFRLSPAAVGATAEQIRGQHPLGEPAESRHPLAGP